MTGASPVAVLRVLAVECSQFVTDVGPSRCGGEAITTRQPVAVSLCVGNTDVKCSERLHAALDFAFRGPA